MSNRSIRDRFLTAFATSACFVSVYNFTNWVTSKRSDVGVAVFSWELQIPFIPIFIIPYWSIDLFFVAAPFFLTSDHNLRVYRRRIFTTIIAAGTCFLLFPLELQFKRPQVEGMIGALHAALDNFNNFWNLAPSLHISLRTILWTVYAPLCFGFTRWLLGIWFLCIGLSTLFCWQHHIIDIFCGQLLGLAVIQAVPAAILAKREPPSRRHKQLALRYLLVCAVCVALCALIWPYGFVLLWPVVSFFLVAFAYWRNDPRVFGKLDGNLTHSAWWIYLPYRLIARAWQQRYLENGLNTSFLTSELSFGALPVRSQLGDLSTFAILDLTAEYPARRELLGERYRNVPMLDLVPPSTFQLIAAVKAIEELSVFSPVYMHCALGLGRSATVAAAWLIYSGRSPNPQSAIESVRAICSKAVFGDSELLALKYFYAENNERRSRQK